MDYQASSCRGKIKLLELSKKSFLVFTFLVLFPCVTFAQSTTTNPLTIDVTITATVLVGTHVRPDTPPVPPPGPINTVDTSDVAIFKGLAYPGSTVFLLKNGVIMAQIPANSDGTFDLHIKNLFPGTYTFGLRAQDASGLQSKLLTFTVFISSGAATTVSGIYIPPTITSDKSEVKKGTPIIFNGYSSPNAEVRLSLLSIPASFEIVKKTTSNASGTWSYTLDSSQMAFGDFEVKAKSLTFNDLSPSSDPLMFKVGNTNRTRTIGSSLSGFRKKCDLNDDSRVNLLDFSIMAFWYKRLGFPEKVDLNTDSRVNLTDLSILAYCWTG